MLLTAEFFGQDNIYDAAKWIRLQGASILMLYAKHKVMALIVRLNTQIEYQLEMFQFDSVFSIIFLAYVMKMYVFVSTASEMAVGT